MNMDNINSIYNLIILKQESGVPIYSDLPLLTVEVFDSLEKVELEFPLILYRGGKSLPFIFTNNKTPFAEHFFKMVFLDDLKGDL